MARATVRNYRPEDREAVRRICFETGMMGDSIDAQYRDVESFADMLTSYYTDAEPESAYVAELDGKVVGYMLSCFDTRRTWKPGNIALRHLFTRATFFRPGTAWFYWRGVLDMVLDFFLAPRRPAIDLKQFPSHTHNNLLPSGRGGGVGREFFFRVFDRLKTMGSRGLHGEVWSRNVNMIQFLQALGYRCVGEPYPNPGLRYPDGSRVYMQMVVRDLADWVPGCWQRPVDEQRSGTHERVVPVRKSPAA